MILTKEEKYLIAVRNNLTPHTSLDQPGSPIINTPTFAHIITTRANIFQLLFLHEHNGWLIEDYNVRTLFDVGCCEYAEADGGAVLFGGADFGAC